MKNKVSIREVFGIYRRETEPTAEAVHRVRERLPVDAPIDALQWLDDRDDAAVRRVRARVSGTLRQTRRRRAPLWLGAAALAAAVLLWVLRPAPAPEPIEAPKLAMALASTAATATIEPSEHVALSYQGDGEVSGAPDDLKIRWESGTIGVEVTPEQGVNLAVHTREAVVRVVGTGFDVARDALGTRVTVSHGIVTVRCVRGADLRLTEGQQHLCLPDTAAAMLGRSVALRERGATPQAVLAAAEDGLARGGTSAVRGELRVMRLGALVSLGRYDDALEEAERYLADPNGPRRDEVGALAARLAPLARDRR